MNWLKIEDLAVQYKNTLSILHQRMLNMVATAPDKKKLIACAQYLELISEISEVGEKWHQLKKYCIARGLKLENASSDSKLLKRRVE